MLSLLPASMGGDGLVTAPASGGSTTPYTTIAHLVFAGVDNVDWSAETAGADASKTVDGEALTINRHANATVFEITDDGFDINGDGASYIEIPAASLALYDASIHRLALAVSLASVDIDTNFNNVTLSLRDADGSDLIAAQLRRNTNYGIRYQTTVSGGSTQRSLQAQQVSAPETVRMEMLIAEPGTRVGGDLGGGSTLGSPGTLTELDGGSRIDRVTSLVDLTSPRVRLQVNPGTGITITIKELRVLLYPLT